MSKGSIQGSTTTASSSCMEPLRNLLYERLRLKFHVQDWPEQGFNPDPNDRLREAARSMEKNWLSCQAGISSSGCCFLVMTGD